ncbi:MAG: tRNA (guanosine(37)-N1)-methyltransferase TrmD [Armatimonadota bacterium]
MRVDIITIFPEMVRNAAACSILGRAQTAGKLDLRVHDLRDYSEGRHRATDDYPFGGGAGMVMLPGPLFSAIESVAGDASEESEEKIPVLLMAPDGERFSQAMARELSESGRFVMVCGHYEGLDERVRERLITREVSIGDYVLTGGELPALVILDAATRLLPGVLGNEASPHEETFSDEAGLLLEYPHYTRPAEFRDMSVPPVLLSGHHANIAKWRRQMALIRTRARRPDLWEKLLPTLDKADRKLLAAYDAEAMQQNNDVAA